MIDELELANQELRRSNEQLSCANEELQTMNEELSHHAFALGQAHDGLRAANERLLEVDRRKNDFLAMLSHELRNPLAPILSSLDILARARTDEDRAARAQTIIRRQVEHLRRLVEDLLDVTRIAGGKVRLQRAVLDLVDLARGALEDQRDAFGSAGVALRIHTDPFPIRVNADPTRLAQVLGNLLQNAAKFTPTGGEVTVHVEADRANRLAIVRVCDTGAGIAPDLLPRVFDPFTQADATLDRSQGGLGLGLAVVKGMIELHGGSVSAASEGVGKGATFTFALPLEAGSPEQLPEESRLNEGQGGPPA